MARHRRVLFALFVASGFAGLLYQVVWVRLAFARFGVITPVLSVVLSVFMLGIALGSWASGRLAQPLAKRLGVGPVALYAAAELTIAVGAFAVPALYAIGDRVLLASGGAGSTTYLVESAIAITCALLPWCTAMGATLPFAMSFLRDVEGDGESTTFSFLYLANVIGAMVGVVTTAGVLIEILGFRSTLAVGCATNVAVALSALALGRWTRARATAPTITHHADAPAAPVVAVSRPPTSPGLASALLFATGFVSMAMEVTWTRAYTPLLGTEVYAFASLLFTYLLGTWIGSLGYRVQLRRGGALSVGAVVAILAPTALLPVLVVDPRWVSVVTQRAPALQPAVVLASLLPFCIALGYLTPSLVDRVSRGRPEIAGTAYAWNTLGCILGPLLASYGLLPRVGALATLLLLAAPFVPFAVALRRDVSRWAFGSATVATAAAFASGALYSIGYEDPYGPRVRHLLLRDHTATVTAIGEGDRRRLLVNGVGMTEISQITAHMAHLPLGLHPGAPRKALAICFGMGTTFRSLMSWGLEVTAVELVPSVFDAFPYFYPDAAAHMASPRAHPVVDDGRRYLRRTSETFDIITIDPPPPSEAAGSGMLYSPEFYTLAKQRLAPDGVVSQWIPGDVEVAFVQAAMRSLVESFTYVRAFKSVSGYGFHVFASRVPIPERDRAAIVARMPEAARTNLKEQALAPLEIDVGIVLSRELVVPSLLADDPDVRVTDDRPFNEYFLLRRLARPVVRVK